MMAGNFTELYIVQHLTRGCVNFLSLKYHAALVSGDETSIISGDEVIYWGLDTNMFRQVLFAYIHLSSRID